MSYTAYPLSWPLGKPRASYRTQANFKTSLADARDGLRDELRIMEADDVVLSTNIELRHHGLLYASRRPPQDTGVAVYFTWKSQQYAFACDCWLKVEDNMQAIRKTVEALRGIARWGTGEMMQAAFAGFLALPEQASAPAWWQVLEVVDWASPDQINAAYKAKAKQAHPDMPGGSHEAMQVLNEARKQGLETNKF